MFLPLLRVRNVLILLIMALLSFSITHGFTSWLPKILENSGLSAAMAGYAASLPLAAGLYFCVAEIGGFTGPLAMGVLVDITGTFTTIAGFLAATALAISLLTIFLHD